VIPKERKRLAEVDFPIAVVSAHSAREKSIRHGHPSTLHLWWARRPLAGRRAMLLALLLPDPCDDNCPEEFKESARELLQKVQGQPGPENIHLRGALLKFIGDFSNWELASNPRYLEVGRGVVKAAQGEEMPLIVDPFAGGGSIRLEALRFGCEAFASDLNPVACLILKVMYKTRGRGRAKSPLDRFRRNLAVGHPRAILWVRHRSKLARPRADFELFSAMPEKREIGWWSEVDLNQRPPTLLSQTSYCR
jgi:hypothetical protein